MMLLLWRTRKKEVSLKRFALLVLLPVLALGACRGPLGGDALGSTRTRDRDGMAMVYVPAGQFTMGSQQAEIDQAVQLCSKFRGTCTADQFADEGPTHTVTLDAFWIDRTEVSNARYLRCVAAGSCTPTSCPDDTTLNGDTQPVVCTTWEQASAYCAWTGGRLPSEAEWEYAARGPQGSLYPWGNDFSPAKANFCDVHCSFSWADLTANDGYTTTAPVGSFPQGASWCGALDMAGNAWEWVQDWYAPYSSDPQTNPVVEQGANGRVLRGGSWDLDPVLLRSATRNWGEPTASNNVSGFRCAVPASKP
jgi:formylglycine-generating enzyme required for sulfatase activity